MIGRTDVNNRLPRFREAMDSIANIEKRGGFEGVSSEVLEYLKAAEPVGLGNYLQIQLPDGHDPRIGPAVLMLHDNEANFRLVHRESELERRAANYIIKQAGESIHLQPGSLSEVKRVPAGIAAGALVTGIPIIPKNRNRRPFVATLPRVIVLGDAAVLPRAYLGQSMAHEADHWDFYINTSGTLQNPADHPPYSPLQILATSEKRAYRTTRRIETNLGQFATARAEALAEIHAGITPSEANQLLVRTEQTEKLFPDGLMPLSLAVEAAGLLFGWPDSDIATRDEVQAFRMLNVIQSPYALDADPQEMLADMRQG